MRSALLKYHGTKNLGDEIQSIAAMQFISGRPLFVDRENLHTDPGEKLKLILNGWYMHNPYNWPPHSNITPLIVSFHITEGAVDLQDKDSNPSVRLLTSSGFNFLKLHEPIGARDLHTLAILRAAGLDAYFSACLTLTLPNWLGERNGAVVCCDIDPKIYSSIARVVGSNLERVSHFDTSEDTAVRFERANNLLEIYKRAQFVITTRLHCALPCLAFGTPVLFIETAQDSYRFDGLRQFINVARIDEVYSKNWNWSDALSKRNPMKHSIYADRLRSICSRFMQTAEIPDFCPSNPVALSRAVLAKSAHSCSINDNGKIGKYLHNRANESNVWSERDTIQNVINQFNPQELVLFGSIDTGISDLVASFRNINVYKYHNHEEIIPEGAKCLVLDHYNFIFASKKHFINLPHMEQDRRYCYVTDLFYDMVIMDCDFSKQYELKIIKSFLQRLIPGGIIFSRHNEPDNVKYLIEQLNSDGIKCVLISPLVIMIIREDYFEVDIAVMNLSKSLRHDVEASLNWISFEDWISANVADGQRLSAGIYDALSERRIYNLSGDTGKIVGIEFDLFIEDSIGDYLPLIVFGQQDDAAECNRHFGVYWRKSDERVLLSFGLGMNNGLYSFFSSSSSVRAGIKSTILFLISETDEYVTIMVDNKRPVRQLVPLSARPKFTHLAVGRDLDWESPAGFFTLSNIKILAC